VKTNDWSDEECEVASREKNKAYLLMLQRFGTRQSTEEFKNRRREEKKVHRKKKRNYENQWMKDIDESRNANESTKLYKLVNSDQRAFKSRITMCKDAVGNITSKAQILERWFAHSDAPLNRNVNNRLSDVCIEEYNDFKPTKHEIEMVTDKVKK
jgi:hypothetical protein